MRVTQFTTYNNFLLNQQNTLSELNKVTQELSTGKKIQNSYDNPTIFVNDLKFQEKINTFTEVKKSASFAQTFANETDTTLNDTVTTLNSFKTKLLDAANDTNNETSRKAIVTDLEGKLEHLKDLANTSIGGKYIFSGSKFGTKPINDEYKYQGNGKKVKAFLGAGVEREYNIDGKTLFLGRDNDYKKHLSLNVVQYNKMKQNPEFVVRGSDGKLYIDKDLKKHHKEPDSSAPPTNEPITPDSEVRMLTGVQDVYHSDTDTYSDGTSYFYLKGKKSNGENIDTKFSFTNSTKVSDLLNKIGKIYGNTPTSKVVDVSVNDMGEIQIKDLKSGKLVTDFFMVASDKNEDTMQDVVKNGDYITSFQKSNFKGMKSLNTVTANNGYFDNRVFKFGSKFFLDDNSREALPNDSLDKVLGQGLTQDNRISTPSFIHITGTDTDGNSVDDTFNIYDSSGNPKRMQDLLNEIKTAFGGDDKVGVGLENGQIVINDKTLKEKNDSSKLSINLTAYEDTDNNGSLDTSTDQKIDIFRSKDIANENENYFAKNGNNLSSNVSQIVKDKTIYFKNGEKFIKVNDTQNYATHKTVLMDTIGDESTPKDINLDFKNINGEYKKAKIELRDTIKTMTAKYQADDNSEIIYDPSGNSTINDKYYDIMGMNVIDKNENKVAVKYLKVSDGSTTDTIAIDKNTTFKDIVNDTSLLTGYSNGKFTTSSSNVSITLEDENQNDIIAGFKSNYQIDLNNDGKIDYGETFNIFNNKGELTPAHTHIKTISQVDPDTCKCELHDEETKGVTFEQLGDVVSMVTSKNIAPNTVDSYKTYTSVAKSKVEVNLDEKGKINLKDNTSSPSKIDLAMYGTSLMSSNFTSLGSSVNDSGSDQTFSVDVDGTSYSMNVNNNESVKSFIDDINNGNLKDSSGNSLDAKASFKDGNIYLDFTNVDGNIDSITDNNLNTHFDYRNDNSFSVNSNNAITIDDAQTDFFDTLQQAIEAVKNGYNYANSNSNDPRNFGIQGAIEAIDHLNDHIRRSHAKIGSVSNEFQMSIDRVETLTTHVKTLQSENIDADIGDATMRLNSLKLSYQALLASIGKVSNLTLLNYLK